jgi:hypothetical protein
MAFSQDGRHLAFATEWDMEYSVVLVDIPARQVSAEVALDFRARLIQFTPDGSGVMAYGNRYDRRAPEVRVALLETETLSTAWDQTLPRVREGEYRRDELAQQPIWLTPGVVFAPESARLHIVHADQNVLTTVDFAAQTVRWVEVRPALSWVERWLALGAGAAEAKVVEGSQKQAVVSADGSRLYVVGTVWSPELAQAGDGYNRPAPLGLQVIDTATGTELALMDTEATAVALSGDGARLYLTGHAFDEALPYETPWTEVWDAAALAPGLRLEARQVVPAQSLAGQPVLLGSSIQQNGQTELAAFDPEDLSVLSATRDWHSGLVLWVTP